MTTRPSPIAAASRPPSSWARPSWAETDWTLRILKFSGNDPYFSWFCSCVAVVWVKSPVICESPPAMGLSISGAETTFPSRTIAKVFSQ